MVGVQCGCALFAAFSNQGNEFRPFCMFRNSSTSLSPVPWWKQLTFPPKEICRHPWEVTFFYTIRVVFCSNKAEKTYCLVKKSFAQGMPAFEGTDRLPNCIFFSVASCQSLHFMGIGDFAPRPFHAG